MIENAGDDDRRSLDPEDEPRFETDGSGFGFRPVSLPLDLSGADRDRWMDQRSAALSAECDTLDGVLGLWESIHSGDADPASHAERAFVAEVAHAEQRDEVARQLGRVLAREGSGPDLVEVVTAGDALPAGPADGRRRSTLLWAADTSAPPELVPVFDHTDDDGPRFDDRHPRLQEIERAPVARYLLGAAPVLLTTATMVDVVAPARGSVVPLNFRTDGRFVWPDALGYYTAEHGLAPYLPLLEAIRAAGYRPPDLDSVARFRAECTALRPDPAAETDAESPRT